MWSDALGEGAFISGVAASDSYRPAQIVLRASKLLTDSSWTGRDRRLRFGDLQAIREYLRKITPDYVVLDSSAPSPPDSDYRGMLSEVIVHDQDGWTLFKMLRE